MRNNVLVNIVKAEESARSRTRGGRECPRWRPKLVGQQSRLRNMVAARRGGELKAKHLKLGRGVLDRGRRGN